MEDGAGHVEQRTRARLLKRLALLAAIGSLQGATPDPPTVLINATLIDGRGGPALSDATIVIRDGRIESAGPSSSTGVPFGAKVLDLRDRVVTPGFIDMHYHVITGAMRYRRNAAGALDSTYDRALAERLLRIALSRGITTIRDPGASPVTAAVALRHD